MGRVRQVDHLLVAGEGPPDYPPATEPVEHRRQPVGRSLDVLLRHPYWTVGVVAGASRLVAAIALGPLQDGVAVPDEIQYIELAESVAAGRGAEAWFPGYGQSLYDSTATFMRPLSALTWLFGSHQLTGQLLAAVFGVAAAVLTTAVASHVVRRPATLLAGLLVALLPSQIFWSSVVLRESMVWAALALLALALGRAKESTGWQGLAVWASVTFLCLYALGDLRQLTAVLAGFCLVLAAAVIGGGRRWTVLVGAVVISLVAPLLTGLGPFGYTYVEGAAPQLAVIRASLSLGAASSIVETMPLAPTPTDSPSADAPSSGAPSSGAPSSGAPSASPAPDSIVVRTPSGEAFAVEGEEADAFSGFPQGFVAVTLRPFPWEPAANAGVLLAKLENVLWAVFYALAAVGSVASWRHRVWTFFPASFVVVLLATAATTQGNLGTAFRHRGQGFWAIAVLSAVGLQWIVDRRRSTVS